MKRRANMTERYAQTVGEAITTNPPPSPQREVEAREQNEMLMRVVGRLKSEEQALIALRYFLELPETEVAQSLNIPQGTVKIAAAPHADKIARNYS